MLPKSFLHQFTARVHTTKTRCSLEAHRVVDGVVPDRRICRNRAQQTRAGGIWMFPQVPPVRGPLGRSLAGKILTKIWGCRALPSTNGQEPQHYHDDVPLSIVYCTAEKCSETCISKSHHFCKWIFHQLTTETPRLGNPSMLHFNSLSGNKISSTVTSFLTNYNLLSSFPRKLLTRDHDSAICVQVAMSWPTAALRSPGLRSSLRLRLLSDHADPGRRKRCDAAKAGAERQAATPSTASKARLATCPATG